MRPRIIPILSHLVSTVLVHSNLVHGLSSPIPDIRINKPIRNIAIVGCGISGLSLAHAIENSPDLFACGDGIPIKVSVYDARPSLNYEAGAGVQLNGGISVLRKINPMVQRAVADASLPLQSIESRTKPWFGGRVDGDETAIITKDYNTLLTIPIEKTFREAGGRVTEELVVDSEIMAYTIMRGALQEALMDTLPVETLTRMKFNKSLVQISGCNNDGINIGFQDGTTEGPFDLVVGCDGVNSAVKDYILRGIIPKTGQKGKQALYSGIRIRYAVQDTNVTKSMADGGSEADGANLYQYFGNGAYALHGIYGAGKGRSPIQCAYIIYLDDDYIGPFRKKVGSRSIGVPDENSDWSQDKRGKDALQSIMLQQIIDCNVPGRHVLNPTIQQSSRFFELGVYFHNPISRSSPILGWSKQVEYSGGRFCTLGGDAAHTMPPFLGQGSNQAIQDSYCLAKKIFEYNKGLLENANIKDGIDFELVLKSYETIRWAPTASISAKAFLLGYLEASVGPLAKFRDAFFFTLGSLGVAKKVFLGAAVPEVGDVDNHKRY